MNKELHALARRYADLEQQRAEIASEISDLKAEAKSQGFDPALLAKVVRVMLMDADKRKKALDQIELFDTYLAGVGLLAASLIASGNTLVAVDAATGNFEFNDDSLWWKGAVARLPASNLKGDGAYDIGNGDLRLTLAATPAAFNDFKWLYQRFPASGGGNLGLAVLWKGATQDYVIRDADVRSGSAHVLGDVGVTVADTTFFHDANLRFTGVTTKQIADVDPTLRSPRDGRAAPDLTQLFVRRGDLVRAIETLKEVHVSFGREDILAALKRR